MKTKSISSKLLTGLKKQKALIAVIVLFIVMPMLSPYFLTAYNMSSLVLQVSILTIMAIGVTYCMVSGDCDLSVGLHMCFAGIMAIRLQPVLPLPMILVVVLVIGAVIGALNAFIVVDQGANAFITTLGMMFLLKGLSLLASDGAALSGTSQGYISFGTGQFMGLYYISWVAIILIVINAWIITHTSFGRNCYAVGGDSDVAEYSGINVKRHRRIAFIISGVCAALAGFCLAAEMNSIAATYGENTSLLVNCGVVVGGTPFNGGYGGIIQSCVGIFFLGVLENAMNILNISSYYQQLIRGIVIVVVIASGFYANKKKRERV